MSKSILAILLSMFLLPLSLSAGTLEMFQLDHPVYKEMDALYTIEGKALPFGARPWTELDIIHLLSAIEPKSEGSERLKERIAGYIRPEQGFRGLFSISISPSMYVHTNPSDYGKAEDAFNIDAVNTPVADIALWIDIQRVHRRLYGLLARLQLCRRLNWKYKSTLQECILDKYTFRLRRFHKHEFPQ